jgi:protein subunit release factor A
VNEADFHIETYTNTAGSMAVAIHVPSGLRESCNNFKSARKSREAAVRRLRITVQESGAST